MEAVSSSGHLTSQATRAQKIPTCLFFAFRVDVRGRLTSLLPYGPWILHSIFALNITDFGNLSANGPPEEAWTSASSTDNQNECTDNEQVSPGRCRRQGPRPSPCRSSHERRSAASSPCRSAFKGKVGVPVIAEGRSFSNDKHRSQWRARVGASRLRTPKTSTNSLYRI